MVDDLKPTRELDVGWSKECPTLKVLICWHTRNHNLDFDLSAAKMTAMDHGIFSLRKVTTIPFCTGGDLAKYLMVVRMWDHK